MRSNVCGCGKRIIWNGTRERRPPFVHLGPRIPFKPGGLRGYAQGGRYDQSGGRGFEGRLRSQSDQPVKYTVTPGHPTTTAKAIVAIDIDMAPFSMRTAPRERKA